jgi:hypothetical protein
MAKKSKVAKKPRRYVPRQTRKFQLRLDNEQDIQVAQILNDARENRREVTAIREGVLLWYALQSGDLEYLFEKFPQYRAQFAPDNTVLIEEFRHLLQQSRAETVDVTPGPKLLNAPKFTLPLLDDDEDEQATVILKRSTGSDDAAANMWNSMLGLQQ